MARTYLFVPRKEESLARELGAMWDARRKHWYVPNKVSPEPFSKWFRTLWLNAKQRQLADELCDLFRFDIPQTTRYEKVFGSNYLRLFKFDPENLFFPTGLKRVDIIRNYMEEDEYIDHLRTKFDLSREDIVLMIEIITTYGGDVPRDNFWKKDPEDEF